MQAVLCGQLIDGTGRPGIPNATVYINDAGRIDRIENGGQIPAGVTVVDLSEYTVIPGLIDCHDHLTIETGDEHAQALESDQYHIAKGLKAARQMVKGGITTLRDVGSKHHNDLVLRESLNGGDFAGPRVISCGEFICRTGGHAWYFGIQVNGTDDVRRGVREALKHGAQFIKVMISGGIGTAGSDPTAQELSDEEIEVLMAEAKRAGRKVAAHIHGGTGARVAIEAGLHSLEHGIYLTKEELALMAEKGTHLVVTHGFIDMALSLPGVPEHFVSKSRIAKENYQQRIAWARELGVKVAAGGDGVHGKPVLELQALVRGGYTPAEALRVMTVGGAELLEMQADIGTLEQGKLADLVALEGDPTVDVAAIDQVRYVMRAGVAQFPHWEG